MLQVFFLQPQIFKPFSQSPRQFFSHIFKKNTISYWPYLILQFFQYLPLINVERRNQPSPHSIYYRTKSFQPLFSTLLNKLKLVYGMSEQSNMHRTLDFCLRPARKKTNVMSTQYKKLAPKALRFTYQNLKPCKSHEKKIK